MKATVKKNSLDFPTSLKQILLEGRESDLRNLTDQELLLIKDGTNIEVDVEYHPGAGWTFLFSIDDPQYGMVDVVQIPLSLQHWLYMNTVGEIPLASAVLSFILPDPNSSKPNFEFTEKGWIYTGE